MLLYLHFRVDSNHFLFSASRKTINMCSVELCFFASGFVQHTGTGALVVFQLFCRLFESVNSLGLFSTIVLCKKKTQWWCVSCCDQCIECTAASPYYRISLSFCVFARRWDVWAVRSAARRSLVRSYKYENLLGSSCQLLLLIKRINMKVNVE